MAKINEKCTKNRISYDPVLPLIAFKRFDVKLSCKGGKGNTIVDYIFKELNRIKGIRNGIKT